MDRRTHESPMDFEYQNGTGPMDSRSPFAQISMNAQRQGNGTDGPAKKRGMSRSYTGTLCHRNVLTTHGRIIRSLWISQQACLSRSSRTSLITDLSILLIIFQPTTIIKQAAPTNTVHQQKQPSLLYTAKIGCRSGLIRRRDAKITWQSRRH